MAHLEMVNHFLWSLLAESLTDGAMKQDRMRITLCLQAPCSSFWAGAEHPLGPEHPLLLPPGTAPGWAVEIHPVLVCRQSSYVS